MTTLKLKERLENHIVIVVCTVAIASFGAGWVARNAVISNGSHRTPEGTNQIVNVESVGRSKIKTVLDDALARSESWFAPTGTIPQHWELEGWANGIKDSLETHQKLLPNDFSLKLKGWANAAKDAKTPDEVRVIARTITTYLETVRNQYT